MANYVKFKQGLKKDFNTTNQPLTNGMIYFVIDENNNGSIYYDTIVDGKKATKNGTVHRVKFSGLPIKITGSVIGTGVISQDGELIEINTSTNHSHGLAHQDFTVTLSNDDTNLKWTRLGNQNGGGFWLKSIRGQTKAPAWFLPDYSAGIAFGGVDTKGIISVKYSQPGVRFAGGNGDAPVWYFTITGANDKTYDLSKIGGHSSDSAKLDHNVTFKIASTADATNGANGTKTDLSGSAVNLYLPTKISGFDLLQASRFQGNADSATYATSAGNAATATKATNADNAINADKLDGLHSDQFVLADKRGSDFSLNRSNYWAGMSTKTGINGSWWHILSMDWAGNDTSNWVSQLALPTQQGGVPKYRRNDSGGIAITSSTWHSFITDENISSQSVNYAKNADMVDGYHAADLFSGGYKTTLDLSSLNNNLYYPVTGASIPANGYHKIKVSVHLNSGTKPSWATHNSGFTTNVELYTTAYGWGTTQGETIILNDSYNFTNCGQVVGFTQNGNNSVPVLWLRGGGKYFVECDYSASWTVRTSLYYTYGSASDTYKQTVEPQSSYPGFKAGNGGAINGTIRAGQVYGAVWNDYAEYRRTKKHMQPGYCVIETGKGDLIKSSERLQPGANIVSDTFGFAIGETEQTKTPLAVSGRVLAYPYEDRDSYQAGDPVCSGPNGTISKMTREEVREYPDRIIGTVSEIPNYEVWGTGNVKVDNRIWIKVK